MKINRKKSHNASRMLYLFSKSFLFYVDSDTLGILINTLKCISIRAFLVAQLIKNLPAMQETQFHSWVGKIPWRRDRLSIPVFLGFPGGSAGKEST